MGNTNQTQTVFTSDSTRDTRSLNDSFLRDVSGYSHTLLPSFLRFPLFQSRSRSKKSPRILTMKSLKKLTSVPFVSFSDFYPLDTLMTPPSVEPTVSLSRPTSHGGDFSLRTSNLKFRTEETES